MKRNSSVLILAMALLPAAFPAFSAESRKPISLHPDNPHYFLFHGKPTVLITSAEHYGAVLNLDFDYRKYLDTLAKDGLNNTRTFSGAYVEPLGAFKITRNTLAPDKDRSRVSLFEYTRSHDYQVRYFLSCAVNHPTI